MLLVVSVFLYLISFFLPSTCDEISSFFQPTVKYISNVPYVSVNNTVFKITPDEFDKNSFLVGARNNIFRFNSSLFITDSVKNGPINDSFICNNSQRDNCAVPKDQDNHVVILNYETNPTPKIISCGTVHQGMCMIHDYNKLNISGFIGDPKDPANYVSSRKNTLAFAVPAPKRSGTAFIIGHEYDGRSIESSPPAISERRVVADSKPGFRYISNGRYNSSIDIKPDLKNNYQVNFIFGFHEDEFSYIISNQKLSKSQGYVARIGRICLNDPTLHSYTELTLTCKSSKSNPLNIKFENSMINNIVTGGHIGPIGEKLAKKLDLKPESLFLYLVFVSSKDGTKIITSQGSVVCGISLDILNEHFNDAIEDCFLGNDDRSELHPAFSQIISGSNSCTRHRFENEFCGQSSYNPYISSKKEVSLSPLIDPLANRRVTSLVTVIQKEDTIALMGTVNGRIMKSVLYSEKDVLFDELFNSKINLQQEESFKRIRPDPILIKNDSLALFAVSDRIIQFPTNSCSIYSRCSACITTKDPLGCGWCGTTCGSSSECESGKTNYCTPVIYSFSPTSGPEEGGTEITIIGDNFGHKKSDSPPVVKLFYNSRNQIVCSVKEWKNEKIVCETKYANLANPSSIVVTVNDKSRNQGDYEIRGEYKSKEKFRFVKPNIISISPLVGPRTGSSNVTIYGNYLDTGSRRRVLLIDISDRSSNIIAECNITSFTSSQITCLTSNNNLNSTKNTSTGYFVLQIDNMQISTTFKFTFKNDPVVKSIMPTNVAISSEVNIQVSGDDLDSITKPILKVANVSVQCNLVSRKLVNCSLPPINKSYGDGRQLPIVMFNEETKLTNQPSNLTISFYPDPKFYQLTSSDHVFVEDQILELRGANLSYPYQLNITVDKFHCEIVFRDIDRVKCKVQFNKFTPKSGQQFNVNWSTIGSNEMFLGKVSLKKKHDTTLSPVLIVVITMVTIAALVLGLFFYMKKSKPQEKVPLPPSTSVQFNNRPPLPSINSKYTIYI